MLRYLFSTASVSVSLILLFGTFAFAGGILDPSFGSGGKVIYRYSSESDDAAHAAALQPDGKILVLGYSGLSGQSYGWLDSLLVRLDPDGSFDTTFGNGGVVKQDFGEEDRPYWLFVQPDGKILVAISNREGAFLVRYHSNGTLDTFYNNVGAGGIFLPQPDGKIITVGRRELSENRSEVALARYNQDGSLDTTFGDLGKFYFYFGNMHVSYPSGAALQPDGKILVSGTYRFTVPGCVPTKSGGCTRHVPFIVRLTPQMLFDRKFGRRAGKEFGPIDSFLFSITLLEPSGSFILNAGPGPKRYSANGHRTDDFDAHGTNLASMTRMPNGKIAGCGFETGQWDDWATVLFDTDGRLIGKDRRDFAGGHDLCKAILAQPDGKLVVAGTASTKQQGPRTFAIMRYLDITP